MRTTPKLQYRLPAVSAILRGGTVAKAIKNPVNIERSRRSLNGEVTGALNEHEREELKRLRMEVVDLRKDCRLRGKASSLFALKGEFSLSTMASLL